MLNDKIVRKIKYWCAKSLVTCGFPRAPLTDNHLQTGKYCDNYPYIFTEASSKLSEELSRSLYERHVRIKKLFSLRDLDLVYSAIHVAIYRVCYTFLFISFSILTFDTSNWQLIATLCMGSASFGIIAQIASKFYLYVLNSNYAEIMCVIETCYICEDLSDNKVLIRKKEKEFIKLRIKKLSNLIYIYGKNSKDKSGFFYALSKDIFNKIDWLNKPRHTTVEDLQNYFSKIEHYLVIGKIGEMQVDENLFPKSNWKKMTSAIDKSFSAIERLLQLLERTVSIFKK